MAAEVLKSEQLRERLGDDALDADEVERRQAVVDEARRLGLEAGLPIKHGSVMPSIPAQLKVIDEPAAAVAYTTAYRMLSWDVHGGPRAFLSGSFERRNDGTVSYEENLTPEDMLSTRALVAGIVAS